MLTTRSDVAAGVKQLLSSRNFHSATTVIKAILSGESRNPFWIPTGEWVPAFAGKEFV